MNTIENNKLIADFMGLELEETPSGKFVYARHEQNNPKKESDVQTNFYEDSELLYHFDFNWLIEVVEKIENIGSGIEIYNNYCKIVYDNETIVEIEENSKKEAVYNACVEFINWYNQQEN